jgi:hypothetical protein
VILHNAPTHRDARFITIVEARGARVEFLSAIMKKHIRAVASRVISGDLWV